MQPRRRSRALAHAARADWLPIAPKVQGWTSQAVRRASDIQVLERIDGLVQAEPTELFRYSAACCWDCRRWAAHCCCCSLLLLPPPGRKAVGAHTRAVAQNATVLGASSFRVIWSPKPCVRVLSAAVILDDALGHERPRGSRQARAREVGHMRRRPRKIMSCHRRLLWIGTMFEEKLGNFAILLAGCSVQCGARTRIQIAQIWIAPRFEQEAYNLVVSPGCRNAKRRHAVRAMRIQICRVKVDQEGYNASLSACTCIDERRVRRNHTSCGLQRIHQRVCASAFADGTCALPPF